VNKATDKTEPAVAGTAASSTRTAKSDPPAAQVSKPDPDDATANAPKDKPAGAEPNARTSDCVVNNGRGMHVGRAVNGKVCSYHAMQYHADGTPR